jgi:hypothetical protein
VARDLAGPWLTGVGIEGGRKLSLDVWAVDPQGRLGLRRQFTERGAVIEMRPSEAADGMLLEGEMRQRDGTEVKLRERVTPMGDESFAAIWEVAEGAGWKIVVDETCERRP